MTPKIKTSFVEYGGVAQMVERSLSMREVPGSIPGASKIFKLFLQLFIRALKDFCKEDTRQVKIESFALLVDVCAFDSLTLDIAERRSWQPKILAIGLAHHRIQGSCCVLTSLEKRGLHGKRRSHDYGCVCGDSRCWDQRELHNQGPRTRLRSLALGRSLDYLFPNGSIFQRQRK